MKPRSALLLLVFLSPCLLAPSFSLADQCQEIPKSVASKALSHIHPGDRILAYCEPCHDVSPKEIVVQTAKYRGSEIEINGTGQDIAYIFVQHRGKYANLGLLADCGASSVSAAIDSEGRPLEEQGSATATPGTCAASAGSRSPPSPGFQAKATWELVDSYTEAHWHSSEPEGGAVDEQGGFWFVGSGGALRDARVQSRWIVRKGLPGGGLWSTVDFFTLEKDQYASASAIAVRKKDIYVGGYAEGEKRKSYWIVRKSTDGGRTWSISDKFPQKGSPSAYASGIVISEKGEIFATGAVTIRGNPHWVTRKSRDNGKTWTTVDDFQVDPGRRAQSSSIALSGTGMVYVVGLAIHKGSPDGSWLVRGSADGGKNWRTLDLTTSMGQQGGAEAVSVAVTRSGKVLVGGTVYGKDLASRWVVKTSDDRGRTWRVLDDFSLIENGSPGSADAKHVSVAPNGWIYVYGTVAVERRFGWKIRISKDDGRSWAGYLDDPGNSEYPDGSGFLVFDLKGVPHLAQRIARPTDYLPENRWIVRKVRQAF